MMDEFDDIMTWFWRFGMTLMVMGILVEVS